MSHNGRSRPVRVLMSAGLLLGAADAIHEGLLEIPRLKAQVTNPPTVPGESKIIEHFAVQHVAFPVLEILLAVRPAALRILLRSRLSRGFLASVAAVLLVPETLVSFREGDLFHRYSFDLKNDFVKRFELVRVGGRDINLVQAQHLALHHWLFASVLIALCVRPKLLERLAGTTGSQRDPHPGE